MSLTYIYVRGILWPEECKLHATRSVTSALKMKKKGGVPSLQLTADYTREMEIEDAIAKKVSVGYDNWYLDYWFTFYLSDNGKAYWRRPLLPTLS